MTQLFLICVAGGVGTGARFVLSSGLASLLGTTFPYGTVVVNVLGSFLIGAVIQASTATDLITPPLRLVLTSGFLGGFTTYSAFNQETVTFLQHDLWGRAIANVGVTLVVCLLAGYAGVATARRLLG